MKKLIILALTSAICCLLQAQEVSHLNEGWRLGASLGFMESQPSVGLTLSKEVTPFIDLAIETTYQDHEGIASVALVTDLYNAFVGAEPREYTVLLDLGFGLGHQFLKEGITDHNYHTYHASLTSVWRFDPHLSLSLSPGYVWRTVGAHIGLHQPRWRVMGGLVWTF